MKTLELKIEDYVFEVPIFEKGGTSWVALSPLCEVLGVQAARQRQRVEKSEFIRSTHMCLPSNGGKQNLLCIDIDCVGEWIFGINPNKVKPDIKERMILFRKKLQKVLYAAVTGHIDSDMVQTLVEEIKLLRSVVEKQAEVNASQAAQISSLSATVDYLLKQNYLNEKYVDKQLASVGGKLLSNVSRKRKVTKGA